jgi:peroxiredoxin Q/BCP
MTPRCTKVSEEFRDRSTKFEATNTIIAGVSEDSIKRYDKFKYKYQFPFTLISDEEKTLCEAFDVSRMKKLYGNEYMGIIRSTYLIDESGDIQAVWDKIQIKGYVDLVLEAVKASNL